MTNLFLELQRLVFSYEHLGYMETSYAKLYAKANHIAPQAWLHALFYPLEDEDIEIIEEKIKNLPTFYKRFLKIHNGFSLFGTTLSFYGLRRDYKRDFDSVWQPFDLCDLNSFDKPIDSNKNHFFFASYDWDGSLIYYNESDRCIYRCTSTSVNPINKWLSFEDFLLSELKRLPILFDKNGIQMDENRETVMPPENIKN